MLVEEGKWNLKVYLADFCALTKRMAFNNSNLARAYDPNYKGDSRNRQKYRKGIHTQYAKWTKYAFRKNNYPCNMSFGLYEFPVYIFAIQNRDSKKILHVCLKKQEDKTKHFHYPVWFNIKPCLRETFQKYGLPYGFISDGVVIRYNKEELKGIKAVVKAEHPTWIASLESFFARIQYEMREELTQENLDRYVEYWNKKRAKVL